MDAEWEQHVADFWATADPEDADAAIARMRDVIGPQPRGAAAVFEWASVHDFVGREAEAVPLYRDALARGLDEQRRPQAVIQLASSLRNIGDARASVQLLVDEPLPPAFEAAGRAFIALALHDLGETTEALRVALRTLAPTLPAYGRAVAAYAEALGEPPRDTGAGIG